jgi:uncharacterized protein with FMN-binding domain
MKKFLISALFIAGFTGYAFYSNLTTQASSLQNTALDTTVLPVTSGTNVSTPNPVVSTPVATIPASTAAPVTSGTVVPAPTPVTKPSGQYKDGTYTGSVADAYYGNVQVEATVSGGKLTNIAFLQYPSDRSTSRYISGQALPLLKSEAIKSQNANVDGISGASYTSQGFVESLSSALSKAKA